MLELYLISCIFSILLIHFYNLLIENNKYAFISILKDLHYVSFSEEVFSKLRSNNNLEVLNLLSIKQQNEFKSNNKINILKALTFSIIPLVNIIYSLLNLWFLFIGIIIVIFQNKNENSLIYKIDKYFKAEKFLFINNTLNNSNSNKIWYKDEIKIKTLIEEMCSTYHHEYILLGDKEQKFIYSRMKQLVLNDIIPFIEKQK